MLPTGHVAAGYLTGYALLKTVQPDLNEQQITQLLWWAVFFGFSPDLDMFYFFIKHKTLLVAGRESSAEPHKKYWSHAPLWWLLASLLIYFSVDSVYWKLVALLLWLGSWSHFILDSIEYGIAWFSPFKDDLYAFKNKEYKTVVEEKGFIKHSIGYLKLYSGRFSFYLEVLIIITAILIYLNN